MSRFIVEKFSNGWLLTVYSPTPEKFIYASADELFSKIKELLYK